MTTRFDTCLELVEKEYAKAVLSTPPYGRKMEKWRKYTGKDDFAENAKGERVFNVFMFDFEPMKTLGTGSNDYDVTFHIQVCYHNREEKRKYMLRDYDAITAQLRDFDKTDLIAAGFNCLTTEPAETEQVDDFQFLIIPV